MIPKTIHYCWFGQKEKPELAKKCIASWKTYCPDYTFMEWNEATYDLSSAPLFVKQAMEAKKWAFATDYIRYQVVYEYGGIYLDTDVQVIKNLDPFLRDSAFFGFESDNQYVASGLGFGAEKGAKILRDLMQVYENASFLDANGQCILFPPNTLKEKDVFLSKGVVFNGKEQLLSDGTHIYPKEYFCPLSWQTKILRKSKRTVAIHWYSFSWSSEEDVRYARIDWFLRSPKRMIRKVIGQERYDQLKKRLKPKK